MATPDETIGRLSAELHVERQANERALAREAALVDAARLDDMGELVLSGDELAAVLANSTAAAEARDKKLKDEARREALEEAVAIVAALALVDHHPDTLWKCHDAIRRAAAAPETPAP